MLVAVAVTGLYLVIFMLFINKNHDKYTVDKAFYKTLYKVPDNAQNIIDSIKSSPELMSFIKTKAILTDKTIPQQLIEEAENKLKKETFIKDRFKHLIQRIENDSVWMIDIRKGARERGITEKQMISNAAKYMIEQDLKNEVYK